MINAEYFIAHNRREVAELTILRRLAQEASRLACAALELPCYGDIRREHLAERGLAAAIGRMIRAMYPKVGKEERDDVSRDAHSAGMAV